jgi:hypothetical protein
MQARSCDAVSSAGMTQGLAAIVNAAQSSEALIMTALTTRARPKTGPHVWSGDCPVYIVGEDDVF